MPANFVVENRSIRELIRLVSIELVDPRKRAQEVEMVCETLLEPIALQPGSKIDCIVRWKPGCPSSPVRLHVVQCKFNFEDQFNERFSISRFISIEAADLSTAIGAALEAVRPKGEYVKRARPNLDFSEADGYPRLVSKGHQLHILLPKVRLIRHISRSVLYYPVLTMDHYYLHFSTLLHMNFAFEEHELREHDLHDVIPESRGVPNAFWFKVAGLAEKRPSILEGDRAKAQLSHLQNGSRSPSVGGVVKTVARDEIEIVFNFGRILPGLRYNVRFEPNDFSFRMQHLALARAVDNGFLYRLFMPTLQMPERQGVLSSLAKMVSSSRTSDINAVGLVRKLNELQQAAVNVIVNMMPPERQAPFLLFGPPGTGKTTTIIAAVVALLVLRADVKVLLTAPSNSACDVIHERILRDLKQEFRSGTRIPKVERLYSALLSASKGTAEIGDLEEARVVIATAVTSGRLMGLDSKFTHIFLDEAGQCTEPESLIPLALNGTQASGIQFILSGDHKQLGPVIRDIEACTLGRLDRSLFERLMILPEYSGVADSDNKFALLLRDNYRAHPKLLEVPSTLFYQGKLRARKPDCDSICKTWRSLPNKDLPIIMHHVDGMESREPTSPSWLNLAECGKVLEYLDMLQNDPHIYPPVDFEEDVIIIAPYLAQVKKITALLKHRKLHCKVGSVEKFQGSEARIVIVTTCRSSSLNDDYDAKHHVGFLRNEKRFNVAITRAQELLIVVGNVRVLESDTHWARLVDQCRTHGAILGLQ